ncbi:MAG: signal peptidase II [Candidatus Omnitrophica bacterium]|nr:signal peptidase II [Candidatus Omnitrophota bacterium]MDD5653049.1 signal peptidase II [Candidatus Omnitrophota bacterium]
MIFPIVIAILFLDQASKFLFTKFLQLNHPVAVIKGVFYLTLVHNRGAAFGILKGKLFLFILASLIALVVIYLNLKDKGKDNPFLFKFALGLILAGGLGNLIDRIFFGYVIDFLDFRVWPVFNLADSAITVGAILLGWSICTRKSAV